MAKPQRLAQRLAVQALLAFGSLATVPQAHGGCTVPTEWSGGVNYASGYVGGLGFRAIVDTGAAHTTLPRALVSAAVARGEAVPSKDEEYVTADGRTVRGRTVLMREVRVLGQGCSVVAEQVRVTIAASPDAEPLLGLSFLNHFPFYGFRRGKLIVETQP